MTLRRVKTYTGGQGYVYLYYFVGKRTALPDSNRPNSTEYIFDVTSDRKVTFSVSIFLLHAAVSAWGGDHGRQLSEAEQYGAVKMRLFQAFDEIENLLADGRVLEVDAESLNQALTTLGVA